MPYSALGDLPDAVKELPKHAQEIYLSAFNSAFKQYDGNEAKSHGTAWAAVKSKYKKDVGGEWVAKEAIHPHGDHVCVCSQCDNELTVEANVKCNIQKCPKCDAPMIAKTAGEQRESLSDDDKRRLLQGAVTDAYLPKEENPDPSGLNIEEVFDEYLIYNIGGQLYKADYIMAEDGAVELGEPQKVIQKTTYDTTEALRDLHGKIIHEIRQRATGDDMNAIEKVLTSCSESFDATDKKRIAVIGKEAEDILTLLRSKPLVKSNFTTDTQYPIEAFAYIGESDNPDTWELRLWEDDKVTEAQLGRISAYLSPGGYNGKTVSIPESAIRSVKRRVRSEYRNLGIEERKIPKWVKEVETRELVKSYISLSEANVDKGRATITVIKPGFNVSEDRYYPAEMLKRDYKVFEGAKMYADHPTEAEDQQLPERSIKSGGWVAVLKDVTCDEAGVVSGVAEIIEPWLMVKLATLRDKDMLKEMGVSINAVGSAAKDTIDGKETLVIETLVACRSVDFVTEPGAGGIVTFYESDRNRDIDLIELTALRERRPDLIKAIESEVRKEIHTEVKKVMENEKKIEDLEGQITTLTTERDQLKETADKAEKDKAKADAQATIKEAVDKAELPVAAKEKLIERFKDAEAAEGIAEAIQSEIDYIAKLSESVKVKGLGATKVDPEKDHKALVESFKGMGMNDEDAETAAKGR